MNTPEQPHPADSPLTPVDTTGGLAHDPALSAAAVDLPADEPLAEAMTPADVPVAPAPAPAPAPIALPVTLTAAKDAAEFVARIFADTQADSTDAKEAEVAALASEAVAQEVVSTDAPAEPVVFAPLAGQQVLILGLGASGLAMARWCVCAGATSVTVADTRDTPPQLAVLQHELPQVRFVAGPFDASLVEGQGLHAVYRSPGLSPADIAPVLGAACASSITVGGELSLYSQGLETLRAQRAYAPAVLAITGTNGKTTVTSLTGQLIAHAGKTVAVAGNIGPTLLDTLTQHLVADTLPEVWVLELSSFQLDAAGSFEPTAAVVLNISQDHLDWHGSMQAYAGAKARIFGQHGMLVLNREDAVVMAMRPEPVRVRLQRPQERAYITFGTTMPQRPGDFGIEEVNGMVWLVRALEADETRKRRKDEEQEIHIQRLMPADALRIRGRHNASNALAALALCASAGCSLAAVLYGLREYRGEPHRVEPIGVLNDVEFFDDSKGTNVGATVAALQGLGADRRIVVILGGEGKGQDFAPLAGPVERYTRAAVLIGRDAPLIRAALEHTGVPVLDAESMAAAVALANAKAHAGDAVLMSPACASFDMFKNYEHRAQVFCEAVKELALANGTELEQLL
ncbi:MurD UDP-N-acetylmuramoylalanine-D-glutamate ligase [Comamonadaceae bacterium]